MSGRQLRLPCRSLFALRSFYRFLSSKIFSLRSSSES